MNKKYWTAFLCLGLTALLGGDRLAAADPDQMDQLKAKMKKEGWIEVAPAVFERQLGASKVERLGYGREGLVWTIGELSQRIAKLQKEQREFPSAKLGKIVTDLKAQLAKTKAELGALDNAPDQGLSNVTAAVAGGSCSSICYSATADAYELANTQGVAAVANASFNSACGYSGDTYAYAYARATAGTTTSTITQSDPKSGTSVTSTATATAYGGNGSLACYSEASSYAQSTALGISYSTIDTNSLCPVPPVLMTASIYGQPYLYFNGYGCSYHTWYVSVANGVAPYSYAWYENSSYVGSGSSYSRYVCSYEGGFDLSVTVTGSNSQSASDPSYPVTIQYEPYCPPLQECQQQPF